MRLARSATVALALFATRCSSPVAELEIELAGPAALTPLVFHGNCLAGYTLAVELRVRETRNVEVVLDALEYRLRDEGSGTELASERLDAGTLDARYGPESRDLAAGGSRTFRVAARADRGTGPVSVSGSVSGDDAGGHRVRRDYALQGAVQLEGEEPDPDSGGACGSPP